MCTFATTAGANGAALILAAMCRSPRRELRRLSARALAALTWNSHANGRKLGMEAREQWRLWVEVAASRQEEIRKHRSFADSGAANGKDNALDVETFQSQKVHRDRAVARRQWALRRRRVLEGPNHANMRLVVTESTEWLCDLDTPQKKSDAGKTAPLIRALLVLSRDRDLDCVLSAARGLASVAFNAHNAPALGSLRGLIPSVVNLTCHAHPEVVTLACDVVVAS